MTQTSTPAATFDYAALVATWTDEMVINSRKVTPLRDGQGNLRDFTDSERAFAAAINTEFSRRVNRP
jgi:hypothetical protein